MSRTAVIAGATGLAGRHLLLHLTAEPAYSRVVALGRRETGIAHPKLTDLLVRFEDLDPGDFYRGADVFCCLGTTIAKAGSQAAFRTVDLDYPAALAKHAAAQGARQFLVVSSVGASPATSNFYLRTKGEMERQVAASPFQAVHIFRPSLLLGDRGEFRLGERIAAALAPPLAFALVGPLRRYHPVQAERVAFAMVRAAVIAEPGVHIYEYGQMLRLTDSAPGTF